MSSTPYAEPLEVQIRPSRFVATLLLGLFGIAAVVCARLPISVGGHLILVVALIGVCVWTGLFYVRRTPRRLYWSPGQGWRMLDWRGISHDLELMPQAYLSSWLVVAHFRDRKRRRRTVLLAQDSTHADSLRRLKVLLRYGTPRPSSSS